MVVVVVVVVVVVLRVNPLESVKKYHIIIITTMEICLADHPLAKPLRENQQCNINGNYNNIEDQCQTCL